MKRVLLSVAVIPLALGLAACGGRERPHPDAPGQGRQQVRFYMQGDALLLSGFDSDGDLRITRAEITAGEAREFTRADTDRNGSIGPLEFQNWAVAALGPNSPFRLDFDRNVDNEITTQEFTDEINARADDYDKDKDGVIVRGDLVKEAPQMRMGPRPTPGVRRGP
jgi:hypothetical protein